YAVSLGGENGLRKLGLCGIHPLTRRYVVDNLIYNFRGAVFDGFHIYFRGGI
ncbi:hypothetical protein CRN37_08415, partial [Vibrio vulnificus]